MRLDRERQSRRVADSAQAGLRDGSCSGCHVPAMELQAPGITGVWVTVRAPDIFREEIDGQTLADVQ